MGHLTVSAALGLLVRILCLTDVSSAPHTSLQLLWLSSKVTEATSPLEDPYLPGSPTPAPSQRPFQAAVSSRVGWAGPTAQGPRREGESPARRWGESWRGWVFQRLLWTIFGTVGGRPRRSKGSVPPPPRPPLGGTVKAWGVSLPQSLSSGDQVSAHFPLPG